MFEEEKQNYYDILDIPPDASPSDIRQAYFRAKSAYGKDSSAVYSLFDAEDTKRLLERIEQAYLVLSNSERRKEYDKTHGFLKTMDEPVPIRKSTAPKNTFTFSGAEAPSKETASRPNVEPSSPPGSIARGFREDAVDYSTPRTLQDSSAAGPPAQDYQPPSAESRAGAVRRMDLAKPYDVNRAMEEEILNETEFRGVFLKKVREYKCISIEELSEFTKISKTYLNCIEAEEFDSLPAPAYVRGFISQVAKALKLPHDKVAAGYMTHYNKARQ